MTEGTPAKVQIVLGWLLNIRLLLMSLPSDKHAAWWDDFTHMLQAAGKKQCIKHEDLETLLGWLQHTAAILTEGKHFLNRICTAKMRAGPHGSIRLSAKTRLDLEFWRALLD